MKVEYLWDKNRKRGWGSGVEWDKGKRGGEKVKWRRGREEKNKEEETEGKLRNVKREMKRKKKKGGYSEEGKEGEKH